MRFTDSQMIEIGRVRERLMDIKSKAQPYPADLLPPAPPVPEPAPTRTGYRLQQLEGGFLHLQNTINSHVDAAKKARQKYQEESY